jgi:hypothetical protein
MLQNLCFPLQIHLSIDVGCVDGSVAQPCADGVDVDSGAKKVCRGRVSDGVGTDRPFHQPWMGACGDAYVLADHPMNAVPGKWLAQPVQEDWIIG